MLPESASDDQAADSGRAIPQVPKSSDSDAAGPGLAHSYLMAQSPTLRRPCWPVPGTFSQAHFPTRDNRAYKATQINSIIPVTIAG
jgi:hypothetical protein